MLPPVEEIIRHLNEEYPMDVVDDERKVIYSVTPVTAENMEYDQCMIVKIRGDDGQYGWKINNNGEIMVIDFYRFNIDGNVHTSYYGDYPIENCYKVLSSRKK